MIPTIIYIIIIIIIIIIIMKMTTTTTMMMKMLLMMMMGYERCNGWHVCFRSKHLPPRPQWRVRVPVGAGILGL